MAKRQYVDTKLEAERKRKEKYAEMDKKRKVMVDVSPRVVLCFGLSSSGRALFPSSASLPLSVARHGRDLMSLACLLKDNRQKPGAGAGASVGVGAGAAYISS